MIQSIKNNKQTINKKASFQQSHNDHVKIVLPDYPTTIITNQYKEENIPENIVVKTTIKEELDVHDLLHFIDVDKLLDVKQSKNVNVYELYQLKDLSKKLHINFSNVNKKVIIERIKDKLNDQFHGQPNLIGYLKRLSDKELKLPAITHAFDIYRISSEKKTELLNQIKKILNVKDAVGFIIKLIEAQWIVPKIKK